MSSEFESSHRRIHILAVMHRIQTAVALEFILMDFIFSLELLK